MKKKIYFVLIVFGLALFISSCRGFKSAPPCPAYSMTEVPANNVNAN